MNQINKQNRNSTQTSLLTETIQSKTSEQLSKLCHSAKNLYNIANFYVRQDFFNLGNYLNYYDLYYMLKSTLEYKNLPAQTSQQILKVVSRNWKAFFRTVKEWKLYPNKFQGRPKPPKYKKKDGEYVVIFTNQQCKIRDGYLYFPKKTNIDPIKTRITEGLKEVRIIPLGVKYKFEIIYEKEGEILGLNPDNILSIDLGVTNLVTAVNNIGENPIIVKGGVVKSVNQYYNKNIAYYKSTAKKLNGLEITKRIRRLTLGRNNKINTIFHRISRQVVNYCIENNIGSIVVGYNEGWKQNISLGKRTNQNFVQIPFHKLIHQIEYKAKLMGIKMKKQEESYTSKCSFLDGEDIRRHDDYLGKRITRGLFKSSDGLIVNADVNAGYNIMKKAFPNAFADGIEGLEIIPRIVSNELFDTVIPNHTIPLLR